VARSLDHLVLATRNLPRMAALFAALGFQVGARNRHPWGTENQIVQFRSSFLELIGLGKGYQSLAESDPAFPFAGFLENYLASHDSGIAMAVLRSDDAAADTAEFARLGVGSGRMLPFSRSAVGPDGSDRTVAFTIAFAEAAGVESAGFFTCEQHRPENFWNTAFQQHANGAVDLAGFTLIASDTAGSASFLSAFAGQAGVESPKGRFAIPIEGGRILVKTPDDLDKAFPKPEAMPTGDARIAAMHLIVQDFTNVQQAGTDAGWTCAPDLRGHTLALWPSEQPTFAIVCTEAKQV
jgi:Glyoxalase-like domain